LEQPVGVPELVTNLFHRKKGYCQEESGERFLYQHSPAGRVFRKEIDEILAFIQE
jgi:hypothetical protein